MSSLSAHDAAPAARSHILDCAQIRFRNFGYGKTTMAEIAGDASMSAANLYRYFDSKQDLGAACANRCMEEFFAALRVVLRRPGLSAAQCLTQFAVEMVSWTYQSTAEQPRLDELVQMILRERTEIVRWRESRLNGLLAEVLSRGNDTGEFEVDDVIGAAADVHAALGMFELPMFTLLYEREQIENRARSVTGLLLRGLERR